MAGRFFVLEGIDGAGKTTLAQEVADARYGDPEFELNSTDHQLVYVHRRDIPLQPEYSANLMRQAANMLWHSGDEIHLSVHFWVSLQATWFAAHTEAILNPVLEAGHDVIVDGWMYKFWSKVSHQGYGLDDLAIIFQGARVPDHVVVLDPCVGAVFDRGRHFRPAELGMHVGYAELNRDTFIEYQSRGLRTLKQFAELWAWSVLDVPEDETVDETAARVSCLVRTLRDDAVAQASEPRGG